MFKPEYQVKQFVARLRSPTTGVRFNVFETGDPHYYLFDPIDPHDCSTCTQFPVLKSRLLPTYRRMLRHGCGNTI